MTETAPAPLEDSEPPVKYASFNTRAMASSIDVFIIMLVAVPVTNWIVDMTFGPMDNQAIAALAQRSDILQDWHKLLPALWEEISKQNLMLRSFIDNIIQLVFIAAYTLPFWIRYSATPGKMLFRLEIQDIQSEERMTSTQAVFRFICYAVSFLPLTLGFVWVAFNKKHQGWHDILAHTAVVVRPRKRKTAANKTPSH